MKLAAYETMKACKTANVSAEPDLDGQGVRHALWMLKGIDQGYIEGEQAHRWLGYAQGVLVNEKVLTLSEAKECASHLHLA